WPFFAPELTADDAHACAVVVGDLRYGGRRNVLIPRVSHLQRGRQVRPELEAVHAALGITLGHLLMQDAAAGGHPLHVTGGHLTLIAKAVTVLDGASENVSDCLDPAMWMPRKSGEVVFWIVVAKVIQQQKRIELLRFAEPKSALQLDASALDGGLGLDNLPYWSE